MTQAVRAVEDMLSARDFLDAGLHHPAQDGIVIRPSDSNIAAARFTIGSHQSEVDSSHVHTLVVSGGNSKGVLHSRINDQTSLNDIRSGTLTYVPGGLAQEYDFKGQLTNTVLGIDDALFKRVADMDPSLPSANVLETRVAWTRPAVHALIEEQFQVTHSDAAGTKVLTESIALRLAYELLSAFGAPKPVGAPPELSTPEITQLIDFIEDHMEENFDLSALAAHLGRDPFGFTRSFKAATGASPHQYVIQRRLMRVKELLRTTDDRLAEITYATGFANQAHMTSTFTKHIGTSPGKWRKEAQA